MGRKRSSSRAGDRKRVPRGPFNVLICRLALHRAHPAQRPAVCAPLRARLWWRREGDDVGGGVLLRVGKSEHVDGDLAGDKEKKRVHLAPRLYWLSRKMLRRAYIGSR